MRTRWYLGFYHKILSIYIKEVMLLVVASFMLCLLGSETVREAMENLLKWFIFKNSQQFVDSTLKTLLYLINPVAIKELLWRWFKALTTPKNHYHFYYTVLLYCYLCILLLSTFTF